MPPMSEVDLGDAGILGAIFGAQKHIENAERRILAASTRTEITFVDGVYRLQDRPDPSLGQKIVLPMGYRDGDKVWVRVKEFVDLGYANGWGTNTPEIVKECERLGHTPVSTSVANCVSLVQCEECGYRYKVDSGG